MGDFSLNVNIAADTTQAEEQIEKLGKKGVKLSNVKIDEAQITSAIVSAFRQIKPELDFSNLTKQAESAGQSSGQSFSRGFSQTNAQLINDLRYRLSSTFKNVDLSGDKGLGDYYQKINSQINVLEQSIGQLNDSSKKWNIDHIKNSIKDLANLAGTAKNIGSLEKVLLGGDTNRLADSFRKISASMSDVDNKLKNWTAAKYKMPLDYRALQDAKAAYQDLFANMRNMTPDEFRSKLAEIDAQVREHSLNIRMAGADYQTFGSKLKSAIAQYGKMFTGATAIMRVVQYTKQAIQATIELDSAMTQLQIVTKSTDAQMASYSDTIKKVANNTASSVTDVVDAMTTYARLGYSVEDSSILADITAKLQNVGDIDAGSAQDAITAISKAFNIDVDDMESAMDKMVVTGNNFAVSVSDLASGINNAGSMLQTAGNSYQESLALLTASNVTIQNIDKASTGLRTIAARLRNTKTELDDLGEEMTTAQYDELVQALTDAKVALVDENGEFKSTYQILKELSGEWKNLSSMQQAALAKTIAGTRQQNVLASIVTQFDEAERALTAMGHAENELENANNTYLESTKAHIQSLKNEFTTLLSSDNMKSFMNDVVDMGRSILAHIGNIIKFIDQLGGIRSVLETLKPLLFAVFSDKIANVLTTLPLRIKSIVTAFTSLATGVKSYSTAQNAANTAMQTGASVASKLSSVIGALGLAFTAASFITGIIKNIEKANAPDLTRVVDIEEVGKTSNDITELYYRFIELSNITSRTSDEEAELDSVTRSLAEALGDEALAVQNAKSSMDDYKKSIADAVANKQDLLISDAAEEVNRTENVMVNNAASIGSRFYKDTASVIQNNGIAPINLLDSQKRDAHATFFLDTDELDKETEALKTLGITAQQVNGQMAFTFQGDITDRDFVLKYVETLLKIRQELSSQGVSVTSGLYQALDQEIYWYEGVWNDRLDALATEANAAVNKAVSQVISNPNIDTSNLEEVRRQVIITTSEIVKANENLNLTPMEIVETVDDMLRLMPEFSEFYAALDGTTEIESTVSSLETLKSTLSSLKQVIGDMNVADALSIPQASLDDLQSAGWNVDAYINEYKEKLSSIGDEWNNVMNGNVDYNERPLLHAADMIAAGWDLAAEEMQDVFTTYTSQYDAGDFTFSITPIMEDGTVLSPEGLDDYIASLNFGGSIQDALDSDEQNLICHIALKSDLDKAGWVDLENQLSDIKARYEEVRAEGTDLRSSLIQTFSNKDDTIAINFTPVVLDEYGNQKEILSPSELEEYANDVINGVHGDIKNIQIGATIEMDNGEATKEATLIRQKIENILSDLHTKYSADQFLPLIQGLSAVDNATAKAKKALDELNEALKEPDYNEGLEARGSNFLAMRKLYEDQAFGSTDYAAYARYFGFVDENGRPLSPEAMGERLQAYERYAGLYQDDKGEWATNADLAMSNFLEDVDKNEGKIVRWTDELGALHTTTMDTLLSWDEEAQHFYFDPEMLFNPGKMKAVADEYGVTIENMMDLMNQIRYHSPDWIDFDETNLKSWLGDAGLMEFDEAGKAVVTYTDKIRDLLEATGMFDSSEIENIMSQVASITSTDGAIDVHLDYDSAAAAADAEGYAKTLTEAINSKISEAGGDLASNLDIAAALIAQIEDANIRQSVIDQLAGVDAELKTQLTEAVQNVDASVEMSEGDGNDDVKESVTTVHDMVTDMDNHTFSFTLEGTNLDETKSTLEDIQEILGDIGVVSANTKTVELPNGRTFERNTGGSDESTQNFDIKFNVDNEEAYKAISELLQYLNEQFESHGTLQIRAEDGETRSKAEALVSYISSQNPEMPVDGNFDDVKSGADRAVTYIEDKSPEIEVSVDTEGAKLAASQLVEDIESQTVTLQVAFESAPEEAAAAISDPNQQANQYFDTFPTNETYSGPFDINPEIVNGQEITDAVTNSIQDADTDIEVDVSLKGVETAVKSQLDSISKAAADASAAFGNAADSASDLSNQNVNLDDQETSVNRMQRAARKSTESQDEMAGSLQNVSNTKVNASNKTQPINQVSSSAQKATGMVTGLSASMQRMNSVQINSGNATSVFQQVASFAQRASSAIQGAIQSLIRWNNTPVQQKSVSVARKAKGTRNAEPGLSLLGDEYSPSGQPKPELVVSHGEAYLAGVHGPTLGTLKRGDVVYTYDETKKILQNNLLSGSIPAFAEGWVGSGGGGLPLDKIRSGLPANASYTDNSTNTYNYNAGGDIGTAATGETQEEAEKNLQDWIEICIDRIERAISRLKKIAESTYKSLQTRISSTRNEIAKVTEEIGIQQQAVARYQQEADSVGLDPSLAALVRNGTIDINEYSEETKKLIDEYQQWWKFFTPPRAVMYVVKFFLTAGKPLEPHKPQRKHETQLIVTVKNYVDWAISN